jgi:hypothetical protein
MRKFYFLLAFMALAFAGPLLAAIGQAPGGVVQSGPVPCGTRSGEIPVFPSSIIPGDIITGASSARDAGDQALASLKEACLAHVSNPGCSTAACPGTDPTCTAIVEIPAGLINWVGPIDDPALGWTATASLHGFGDHDYYFIRCTECD